MNNSYLTKISRTNNSLTGGGESSNDLNPQMGVWNQ